MHQLMKINFKEVVAPSFEIAFNDVMKHRYTHYWHSGGRGSTKSSFIAHIIPLLIMGNSDVHAVVLRKVANTLKNSVYNQIVWSLTNLGIQDKFKIYKAPLKIVYLATGQEILFLGCDDPLKIKGTTVPFGRVGLVWFEELDQFDGMYEIRSILQSLIRKDGTSWVFYSYNPPKSRNNWVNEEVHIKRDDRKTYHTDYTTVSPKWLGEQFIAEAEHLRKHNTRAYEHEYLGIVIGSGGTIFENLEIRTITDEEIKVMDKFYYGLDFGFAIDPLSWSKLYYHNNRLYILDEIYEIGMSNKLLSDTMKQKGMMREIITCDSAEPKSIAELKSYGFNVIGAKKGADSVDYGIKWLQKLDAIIVDPNRTPNAYNEFLRYEYDRNKEGNFISRYPDRDNHYIDSCRYALESIMRNKYNLSGRRL